MVRLLFSRCFSIYAMQIKCTSESKKLDKESEYIKIIFVAHFGRKLWTFFCKKSKKISV